MKNISELEMITGYDAEGNPIYFIQPLVAYWIVESGDKELDRDRFLDARRRKLDADIAAFKALGVWDLRVGQEEVIETGEAGGAPAKKGNG